MIDQSFRVKIEELKRNIDIDAAQKCYQDAKVRLAISKEKINEIRCFEKFY